MTDPNVLISRFNQVRTTTPYNLVTLTILKNYGRLIYGITTYQHGVDNVSI